MEVITHRRVLNIALPILISNATVPILGAVDTGVVGQLGEVAPIGAVGLGAIILTSIFWFFGFLRMGTVGLTSQALGAKDDREVEALLARVLIAGLGFGALLILVQVPLFWMSLAIAPSSVEVEALAKSYLGIRIWSAPAAIALYGISGWLLAHERARAVLLLQVWMNGLNILLDLWFVLGLDWGVEGVAFATFIAEWSGALLGLVLCQDTLVRNTFFRWARIFDWERLINMAVVNIDILIRSFLLQVIFVSFIFISADLDDVSLAANQVLLQFVYITAFALDGFAMAAETLTGQALGVRNVRVLRRGALMTIAWGAFVAGILSMIFFFWGDNLIDVMTTASLVRDAAKSYLLWMLLAPILGVWAWMFDGIFIGATQTRDMRNMMFISFVIYWISVAVLYPFFGNHGLWCALLVSFLVRGITLGLRYPRIEARAAG